MTIANCMICDTEFKKRHVNHVTCKSSECISKRKRITHTNWRRSTGRNLPKENLWTEQDKQFLYDNRLMETKDIAEILGRTPNAVREKRCRMKLPQLSICVKCKEIHQTINQHNICINCVPNQKEYATNYRNGLNGRWMMYRSNAKKRNMEFDLTIEQFSELWQKPCTYCGGEIITIGIDRIDSSIGYVAGNIVPCCHRCNEQKNDLSLDAWIKHIKTVLQHMGV